MATNGVKVAWTISITMHTTENTRRRLIDTIEKTRLNLSKYKFSKLSRSLLIKLEKNTIVIISLKHSQQEQHTHRRKTR